MSEIDEASGDSEQEIALPGQDEVVDVRDVLPEGSGPDQGSETDISTAPDDADASPGVRSGGNGRSNSPLWSLRRCG